MHNWTKLTNEDMKWIGVDFDGTICKNTGFPNFTPLEPTDGCVEALQKLDEEGYKLIVFTARAWNEHINIEKYCEYYNIPVRRIVCGKPLFVCMIDDVNIEFKGDWSSVMEKVDGFNKHGKS